MRGATGLGRSPVVSTGVSLRLYDTATRLQRPLAQLRPGHVLEDTYIDGAAGVRWRLK